MHADCVPSKTSAALLIRCASSAPSLLPLPQREANQLVEEFMLLANMTTARMVAEHFPDRSAQRAFQTCCCLLLPLFTPAACCRLF